LQWGSFSNGFSSLRKSSRLQEKPLWLGGKVNEWENKRNQRIPGSLPNPGNLYMTEMFGKFYAFVGISRTLAFFK
jgi:hypothetical protein